MEMKQILPLVGACLLALFNVLIGLIVMVLFAIGSWCVLEVVALKLNVNTNETEIQSILKILNTMASNDQKQDDAINTINQTRFKPSDGDALKELIRSVENRISSEVNTLRVREVVPLREDMAELQKSVLSIVTTLASQNQARLSERQEDRINAK